MRIDSLEMRIVKLELVRPFRTSSSYKTHLEHILIRVMGRDDTDRTIEGWGECACPSDPYYCPETVETCWHILDGFLAPVLLGSVWDHPDRVGALFRRVKGNRFAKAGLEMACWDAWCRAEGRSLADALGATRARIHSGVSLGIEADRDRLFDQIDQFVEEGYHRIKLKIAPGHDVEVVQAVRERWPDLPLQVDANSAYTLDDLPTLQRLDAFNLLLIEQPLAHDDIIDHVTLQKALETPVCLDESIHSADDARKAIDLGACRIINIKTSRVGGLSEAKRIHDLCLARGIPVWCGGMHEYGVGRAANVALAALPGFTLPGDVSGSDKYYREDVIDPPILATRGTVAVSNAPGLGVQPRLDRIDAGTTRRIVRNSA